MSWKDARRKQLIGDGWQLAVRAVACRRCWRRKRTSQVFWRWVTLIAVGDGKSELELVSDTFKSCCTCWSPSNDRTAHAILQSPSSASVVHILLWTICSNSLVAWNTPTALFAPTINIRLPSSLSRMQCRIANLYRFIPPFLDLDFDFGGLCEESCRGYLELGAKESGDVRMGVRWASRRLVW